MGPSIGRNAALVSGISSSGFLAESFVWSVGVFSLASTLLMHPRGIFERVLLPLQVACFAAR